MSIRELTDMAVELAAVLRLAKAMIELEIARRRWIASQRAAAQEARHR
jgi:hypothetical protein